MAIVVRFAHRFLLVLIVFAVIGGPAMYLAQPTAAATASMTTADMPCDMAMPMADAGHGAPMVPCKGMTPECIKQIGCIVDVALPVRLTNNDGMFAFSPVTYWSARSMMAGLVRKPEHLPPRTA